MTHPYKAGWRDSFIRVFFDDKKEEKDDESKHERRLPAVADI